MATAIPSMEKKVIWSWKLNAFQCDGEEEEKWDRYSDFENEEIEKVYQREGDTVDLRDRIVDLNYMIQIKENDDEQITRVRREEVDARTYFREQRFCSTEQPFKALAIGVWNPEFIIEWENRFETSIGRPFNYPEMLPEIVEQAAEGILTEAIRQGKEFDGKKFHDELLKVKNEKLEEELGRRCAFLYTHVSFLCPLLNSTLRNNDRGKIDTLGAYCHLLWYYLYTGDEEKRTLYRGAELSGEIIDEYKRAKAEGQCVKSLAFTSTSKNRQVAEMFGNTLFIIKSEMHRDEANWCKDISSISKCVDEEEVLITGGHPFIIDKIDFENGKHVIYLTLTE